MPYKKQELPTLRQHLSSPPIFWLGSCCSLEKKIAFLIRKRENIIVDLFQIKWVLYCRIVNNRWRIPKRQSQMNNPEKLATQGTQDEDKEPDF
jgi:hypothetical protein